MVVQDNTNASDLTGSQFEPWYKRKKAGDRTKQARTTKANQPDNPNCPVFITTSARTVLRKSLDMLISGHALPCRA